jgi:hypothetical protein
MAGAMRKRCGVVAGVPVNLIVHRGKLITVEMKSPAGPCNSVQREVRDALLKAGARWWVCRSAHEAMWA